MAMGIVLVVINGVHGRIYHDDIGIVEGFSISV